MSETADTNRKILLICLVLLLSPGLQKLYAQQDSIDQSGEGFIQALQIPEKDKGVVRVYQDRRIVDLIGSKQIPGNIIKYGDKTLLSMNGWRIQIFSGNNQATAKEEAFRKEAIIKAKLPELKPM
jgi:hypothetical protein